MKKLLALVIAILMMTVLFVGCSEEKPTIVVGYTIYAPMNFKNDEGKLVLTKQLQQLFHDDLLMLKDKSPDFFYQESYYCLFKSLSSGKDLIIYDQEAIIQPFDNVKQSFKSNLKQIAAKANINYRYNNYILGRVIDNQRKLTSVQEELQNTREQLRGYEWPFISFTNTERFQRLLNRKVEDDSILVIETNEQYNEMWWPLLSCLVKTNKTIDIIVSPNTFYKQVLTPFYGRVNIFILDAQYIAQLVASNYLNLYKYVFFNSYETDGEGLFGSSIATKLATFITPQGLKYAFTHHAPLIENMKEMQVKPLKMLCDVSVDTEILLFPGLFPCTFDSDGVKRSVVRFLVVNTAGYNTVEYSILFDAVKEMQRQKLYNFHVSVIDFNATMDVPTEISAFISVSTFVEYNTIYRQVNDCDYLLLPVVSRDRVYTNQISAILSLYSSLALSFVKPTIISSLFYPRSIFNDENSLGFDGSEGLLSTMINAINPNNEVYRRMERVLAKKREEYLRMQSETINDLMAG